MRRRRIKEYSCRRGQVAVYSRFNDFLDMGSNVGNEVTSCRFLDNIDAGEPANHWYQPSSFPAGSTDRILMIPVAV